MRVLVLGGQGMLGRALVREARRRRWSALGPSRSQVDLCDGGSVLRLAEDFRPSLVVNAAAFTRVDDCETELARALEVNGTAVAHGAEAAASVGARFVQISSDYVFDGWATEPYGEDASTAPISVYGESKLRGEEMALGFDGALVLRSSWLFGPEGDNFALTILRLLENDPDELRVVDDQVGAPTYTPFLARAVYDLVGKEAEGILHYRNRDVASWFDFANEIANLVAPSVAIRAVKTDEFPRPARRPAYSVLDVRKFESLVGHPVESWSAGLSRYLQILREGATP